MTRAQRRAHLAIWVALAVVLGGSLAHAASRRTVRPVVEAAP